ncbi:MAG TPA: methyltransferase domain-containing protein [Acidobacteriota bacterium]|nr:methyltransferase domain-containing protein [Acidobacteriota bacterium]
MKNKRLTDSRYWQSMQSATDGKRPDQPPSGKRRIRDRLFPGIERGYAAHLAFDVACAKYLPKGDLKLVEIGSAPGDKLLRLHRNFGHVPYGVEYTQIGADQNRALFEGNGISADNVIQSDFFDDAFQAAYREHFDIVMSNGFIEHFDDTADVIAKHLDLLKPGGTLSIAVPNFRWFNYALIRFFAPHTLKAHNLAIMRKKKLLSYFRDGSVDVVVCKYIGTLNLGLIYGPNKTPVKLLLMKLLLKFQRLVDIMLYLVVPRGGFESFLFSPYLLFVGRKQPGRNS